MKAANISRSCLILACTEAHFWRKFFKYQNWIHAFSKIEAQESNEPMLSDAAVGPMLGILVSMSLLFPLSMLVHGIVEVRLEPLFQAKDLIDEVMLHERFTLPITKVHQISKVVCKILLL